MNYAARTILSFNIDHFFASVEQNRHPDLRGKPVIIGVPKGNTSGVVVSVSIEACKSGVGEGMSIRQAQRACPGAYVLNADYAAYKQIFTVLMDTLAQYSPLLEPGALGSAYMDITACHNLFGDAEEICAGIANQVTDRLNLPLSIGCASNKLVAKIAAGMGKGFGRVPFGSEDTFIAPKDVCLLDAVNDKIEKQLKGLGVKVIGQLAKIPQRLLIRQFGQIGSIIKKQSLGIDLTSVKAAYPPEIINIEHMFDELFEEPSEVEEHLRRLAGEAWIILRKRNALAGEVMLIIADELQTPIPALYRFKKPTDSISAIVQALEKLLISKMKSGMKISRVQVIFSDITFGCGAQLSLIGSGESRDRLDRTVELIRERFGESSVFPAAALAPEGRARTLLRIAAG